MRIHSWCASLPVGIRALNSPPLRATESGRERSVRLKNHRTTNGCDIKNGDAVFVLLLSYGMFESTIAELSEDDAKVRRPINGDGAVASESGDLLELNVRDHFDIRQEV